MIRIHLRMVKVRRNYFNNSVSLWNAVYDVCVNISHIDFQFTRLYTTLKLENFPCFWIYKDVKPWRDVKHHTCVGWCERAQHICSILCNRFSLWTHTHQQQHRAIGLFTHSIRRNHSIRVFGGVVYSSESFYSQWIFWWNYVHRWSEVRGCCLRMFDFESKQRNSNSFFLIISRVK